MTTIDGQSQLDDNLARVAKLIRDSDAETLAEFPTLIRDNPDAAYQMLRAAGLISAVIRNGVSAYDYPNPKHPAIRLWLSSAPKKQRRTT